MQFIDLLTPATRQFLESSTPEINAQVYSLGYTLFKQRSDEDKSQAILSELQNQNLALTKVASNITSELRQELRNQNQNENLKKENSELKLKDELRNIISENIKEKTEAIASTLSEVKQSLQLLQPTKSDKLVEIGKEGEKFVKDVLSRKFIVEDVHKTAKSGDLLVNKILSVEVKNYSNPIVKQELDKFERDLEINAYAGGVFISLKSNIPNMSNFSLKELILSGRRIPVLYLVSNNPDLIELAVDYVLTLINFTNRFHMGEKTVKCESRNIIFDKVMDLSELLTTISKLRSSLNDMTDNVFKQANSMQCNINLFEVKARDILNGIKQELELNMDREPNDEFVLAVEYQRLLQKLALPDSCRDNVFEIMEVIKTGSWKKVKNGLTHSSGRKIYNYKHRAEIAIPCKMIKHDIIYRLLLELENSVSVKDGELLIDINNATKRTIKEMLLGAAENLENDTK